MSNPMTGKQAAKYTSVNYDTFAREVRLGRGPKHKIINARLKSFQREDLDAWLASRQATGSPATTSV